MRLSAALIFVAVVTSPITLAQKVSEERLSIVTVCDILLNQAEFNGRTVAILGRYISTDEGRWLDEDDCGNKPGTDGIALRALVWLEGGGNLPSAKMPVLDRDSLREKLVQVSKTTKLGRHIQYRCTVSVKGDGQIDGKPECRWPEVPDQWVIAIGRVETQGDRGYGVGHLNGAPAQVFVQRRLLFVDEKSQEVQDPAGK